MHEPWRQMSAGCIRGLLTSTSAERRLTLAAVISVTFSHILAAPAVESTAVLKTDLPGNSILEKELRANTYHI